jgi:hypothetical protein
MELVNYLRIVRRRWRLVAVIAVLGTLLGLATSLLASGPKVPGQSYFLAKNTLSSSDGNANLQRDAVFCTEGVVPKRVADKVGADDSQALAAKLTCEPHPETNLLYVAAADTDPRRAELIADTAAAQLVTYLREVGEQTKQTKIDGIKKQITALEDEFASLSDEQAKTTDPTRISYIKTRLTDIGRRVNDLKDQQNVAQASRRSARRSPRCPRPKPSRSAPPPSSSSSRAILAQDRHQELPHRQRRPPEPGRCRHQDRQQPGRHGPRRSRCGARPAARHGRGRGARPSILASRQVRGRRGLRLARHRRDPPLAQRAPVDVHPRLRRAPFPGRRGVSGPALRAPLRPARPGRDRRRR